LRTSDEELEKRNFKVARDVLASVWEDTIINEPVLDIQNNESSETMQVDEEAVSEDLLKTYPQQVQVQEKLIADR
ncbi:5320_t:CDS:2, partial [Racocetra persica]